MNYLLFIAFVFAFGSKSFPPSRYMRQESVITKSCDLNKRLNDTLIIEGIYSSCMEYSFFQTMEEDQCSADYKMELELPDEGLDEVLVNKIYAMQACNASRRLKVRGIVEKSQQGYGHLNSNNSRIGVLEILEYDPIKYSQSN